MFSFMLWPRILHCLTFYKCLIRTYCNILMSLISVVHFQIIYFIGQILCCYSQTTSVYYYPFESYCCYYYCCFIVLVCQAM